MRPQFFPWLFDDLNAWEKSLADPRFSYELPIDNFMAIYQLERKPPYGENSLEMATPMFPTPTAVPAAPLPMPAAASPFAAMPIAMPSTVSAPVKEEPKHEEGILSQDEIDALLSGL